MAKRIEIPEYIQFLRKLKKKAQKDFLEEKERNNKITETLA